MVETIIGIISEGLNSVCVINLKVLNGNIDDLSSPGRNEILGALLQDRKCTPNRFIQNQLKTATHVHSVTRVYVHCEIY